jgi:hypothetical protein
VDSFVCLSISMLSVLALPIAEDARWWSNCGDVRMCVACPGALLHASFPGCSLSVDTATSGFVTIADLSELALSIRTPDGQDPVVVEASGGRLSVRACVDAFVLLGEVCVLSCEWLCTEAFGVVCRPSRALMYKPHHCALFPT